MEPELTYEESELLIEERFREYPRLHAVFASENFDETLDEILLFADIDAGFFDMIKSEIALILTLYVPLNELAQNIQESTGISPEKAETVVTLVETLILQPVYDDLVTYQYLLLEKLGREGVLPEVTSEIPMKKGPAPSLQNIPETSNIQKERLELRPENAEKPRWNTAPVEKPEVKMPPILENIPETTPDLKERLELRPKNVMRQTFAEPKKEEETDGTDDDPTPLTRTQILQSLSSKRTMAGDIASIHKTDTHT